MARFIEGEDRCQGALVPEHLDHYVSEENLVQVIAVCVDERDLPELGFKRVIAAPTGRPSYRSHEVARIRNDWPAACADLHRVAWPGPRRSPA